MPLPLSDRRPRGGASADLMNFYSTSYSTTYTKPTGSVADVARRTSLSAQAAPSLSDQVTTRPRAVSGFSRNTGYANVSKTSGIPPRSKHQAQPAMPGVPVEMSSKDFTGFTRNQPRQLFREACEQAEVPAARQRKQDRLLAEPRVRSTSLSHSAYTPPRETDMSIPQQQRLAAAQRAMPARIRQRGDAGTGKNRNVKAYQESRRSPSEQWRSTYASHNHDLQTYREPYFQRSSGATAPSSLAPRPGLCVTGGQSTARSGDHRNLTQDQGCGKTGSSAEAMAGVVLARIKRTDPAAYSYIRDSSRFLSTTSAAFRPDNHVRKRATSDPCLRSGARRRRSSTGFATNQSTLRICDPVSSNAAGEGQSAAQPRMRSTSMSSYQAPVQRRTLTGSVAVRIEPTGFSRLS